MIENNKVIATVLGKQHLVKGHTPELPERTSSRLSKIIITEESVFSKLLHLNSNKTPGPDNIYPCLLRSCSCVASLCKLVCYLFNQSLYTS